MMPKLPVLYLPGVDGTGRLLFRQERLLTNFDVHCMSYPQDDTHSYADLVTLGVRTLEERGPSVVLAESFGGGIALMISLQRPELVRRLVLVNTFARYPRRLPIDVLSVIGPWFPWTRNNRATRPIREFFFFGPEIPKESRDAWWNRTDSVPMRVYGHRFRLLHSLDLRSRLSEIKAPAVVFMSSNDWVVPAAAGRLLAKQLPRAKAISIPVGHAAMVDPRVDVGAWLADASLWE
jgi:pimeloyl-ACP methyl ester carboxylesterase